MQPNKSNENKTNNHLSRADVIKGTVILICAQLSAASTASCVKALPSDTPSFLRGLWRQALTSFIFTIFTVMLYLFQRKDCNYNEYETKSGDDSNCVVDERTYLVSKKEGVTSIQEEDDEKEKDKHFIWTSPKHLVLVGLTVVGATLLNDSIVVALRYTSSAAVMCLCNTTPIWLILYAIINCKAETPGTITIMGAFLSLIGTIICATAGGEGDESQHENESIGAIIATLGGIGGAIYMTACRKIAPSGRLHPIHLSLIINVGMTITTLLLCVGTLPNGIEFFSTDITKGFFGFLSPKANPAAVLHSVFPDIGGNFGIMLSLLFFEPLIVSMVMLTEPLNASLIAMYAVNEAPPSRQTVMGVLVVLIGCAIVLWESNIDAGEEGEPGESESLETEDHAHQMKRVDRRRRSSTVLYSNLGQVAPEIAMNAACSYLELNDKKQKKRGRLSLPAGMIVRQNIHDRPSLSANMFGNSLRKMLGSFRFSEKEEEGEDVANV